MVSFDNIAIKVTRAEIAQFSAIASRLREIADELERTGFAVVTGEPVNDPVMAAVIRTIGKDQIAQLRILADELDQQVNRIAD